MVSEEFLQAPYFFAQNFIPEVTQLDSPCISEPVQGGCNERSGLLQR